MNKSFKDRSVLVTHGLSLELPLEHQGDYLTPNERFFVCNSGTPPQIALTDYSLRIWGAGVNQEMVFTYKDLLALEQVTVPAVIECAGNHRDLFRKVDGKTIVTPPGTSELIWSTGAVGMAEWTGVRLAEVLQKAGIVVNAIQVSAAGGEKDSNEGLVQLPLPIAKAMDKNTLLALQMNGQPLPEEHGFPVRVLVPGWIGAYSIKWVQDIEVSCEKTWVRRNTESYVMMGDLWPAERYAPSKGMPLTSLNIKSALSLPWNVQLTSGEHHIHGYARSPGCKISTVEWSEDEGYSWQRAALIGNNEKFGWVRFEFDWTAYTGNHTLMTRATDESGQTQPTSVPFNNAGYLYNAIYPHPVNIV